jgi:hypothetical protein
MEIVAIPRVLRQKWSEDEVDAVIELINKSNLKLKEDVLVFVEEKFERILTEDIAKVGQKIAEENEKMNEKISNLDRRIAETHANIIKWMFIFWMGQIGAILGILFAFFKS